MKKIVFLLILSACCAYAELSPDAYKMMQESAPEFLFINVEEAEKSLTGICTSEVMAYAEVLKVERTATGLKPSDKICIKYTLENCRPPMPGPSPVPVLKSGSEYPVFLRKSEKNGCYTPDAGGMSFRVIQ